MGEDWSFVKITGTQYRGEIPDALETGQGVLTVETLVPELTSVMVTV